MHSASRVIDASPMDVYRAFERPGAMEQWLPPTGMEGRMERFDFRDGGSYRMRLTYLDARGAPGKSTEDSDEVEVQLVSLTEGREIRQTVVFDADDPAFAGVMRMTWTFEPEDRGTFVTVRAEDVPDGIRAEDHERAMRSTLENLAAFIARRS